MHLEKLTIRNMKCFGNPPLVVDFGADGRPLAGWNVVAGRNGTGKSALLQAIGLAVLGHRAQNPTGMGHWMSWVRNSAQELEIKATVRVSEGDRLRRPAPPPASETGTVHGVAGVQRTVLLDFDVDLNGVVGASVMVSGPWSLDSLAEGIEVDDSTGWYCVGYGATRRNWSGSDSVVPAPPKQETRWSRLRPLFEPDSRNLETVQWLTHLDYVRLGGDSEAGETLRWCLNLLNDDLLPPGEKAVGFERGELLVERAGTRVGVSQLSDGYQTTIGFVLDIARKLGGRSSTQAHGMVLTDEVELHIHPEWQHRIGPWLTSHFPKIQFIVTTHSPFVCQTADWDSGGRLIVLESGENGTTARILGEEEHRSVTNGTIDDVALSAMFSMPSARTATAERALDRMARLGIAVQDGRATEAERAEYRGLRARFSASTEVVAELRALARGPG